MVSNGKIKNIQTLFAKGYFYQREVLRKACVMANEEIKVIAQNKKARHDYFIEQTIEAGIVLSGTEVKSIRQGKVNLKDSYATIEDGEVILNGMHISPYEQGNIFNKDPLRDRKLLLHKREINKLIGLTQQKGMALVPVKLYFRKGKVKVELAVAKGKKLYDKRSDIAERDARREIDRKLKESVR
jgi:SsrA-binding protein